MSVEKRLTLNGPRLTLTGPDPEVTWFEIERLDASDHCLIGAEEAMAVGEELIRWAKSQGVKVPS